VDRAGGTVARPLTSVGSAIQRPTAHKVTRHGTEQKRPASRESAASGPFGVGLSLAANLAQAQPTAWGRVVAAGRSGAFLVAVSMIERRPARRAADEDGGAGRR
jgi:hypothetical protein